MSVTIFHNPRCSKSRKTLELLRDNGAEPKIIEYLKAPPNAQALKEILEKLDLEPRGLMRKGEEVYKKQGLARDELGEGELIDAMVANPILIERPIVLANGKAALGRPPESVLQILSGSLGNK